MSGNNLLESILYLGANKAKAAVNESFSPEQVSNVCVKAFSDPDFVADYGIDADEVYAQNRAQIDKIVAAVEGGQTYSMAGGDSTLSMSGGALSLNGETTLSHEEAVILVSLLFNDEGNSLV